MAAYIDLTSTSSSVKAMIYGLDTNYGRTDRTFELYISRTASGSAIDSYSGPIAANVANLGLFTFRGLDPDTKYYVSGVIFYTTGTGASARTDLDQVSIYTESGGGSTPDPGPSEENIIPVTELYFPFLFVTINHNLDQFGVWRVECGVLVEWIGCDNSKD